VDDEVKKGKYEDDKKSLLDAVPQDITTCFGGQYKYGNLIKFEDVNCFTPVGKTLVKNLNFELNVRQHILIVGPSGSGKSSLLRILTGLWPSFTGTITRPFSGSASSMLCLQFLHIPQKPYLTSGTLWSQIIYPLSQDICPFDENELLHLLRLVNLEYLFAEEKTMAGVENEAVLYGTEEEESDSKNGPLRRRRSSSSSFPLHEDVNWGDVLSPGEQQRISIARVFFHKPKFVLLDEATSSLSEDMETEIYHTLHKMGMTILSVGHRSSLHKFHTSLLSIGGPGNSWSQSSIS